MTSALPVIHAVTTDEVVARADFVERATAVMHALGARGAVHLRAPFASGRQLYDLASLLVPVQQASGAWLIINDRIDVALATGARRPAHVPVALGGRRPRRDATRDPRVPAARHRRERALGR